MNETMIICDTDGTLYMPFTGLAGMLAKATDERPFDAPAALVAAARDTSRIRGPWFDEDLGDVPTCFLSDVDTTGGNSGSPMIDSQGRLVGLLFDGVWDDLSGDFAYAPRLSRSISVDMSSGSSTRSWGATTSWTRWA